METMDGVSGAKIVGVLRAKMVTEGFARAKRRRGGVKTARDGATNFTIHGYGLAHERVYRREDCHALNWARAR